MKMKILFTFGFILTTLAVFCQCNFAVEEYTNDKVYLFTESTEFTNESNKKNKLIMAVGIQGYDNYILALDLGPIKKNPLKERVTIYFDQIKPLTLTKFQSQNQAFISKLNDRELNKLYDHDIIKIEFVCKGFKHTFEIKSKDKAKHVNLID